MAWSNRHKRGEQMDERLPAPLRDQQLAAQRTPLWLRVALVSASTLVAIYFIATQSGPYRWVMETQATLWTPDLRLGWLVTWIVCALPSVAIILAISRRLPPTMKELSRPPRARALKR